MSKRIAIVRFIVSYISGFLGGLVVLFAAMVFLDFPLMESWSFSMIISSIPWLIFMLITHVYVKFKKKNLQFDFIQIFQLYIGINIYYVNHHSCCYLKYYLYR